MTVAECVLQADDDHRVLTVVKCDREHPGDHSHTNRDCGWRTETLRYQSAAIGEGHCPWGHGRLGSTSRETEPGDAVGHCDGCHGVWEARLGPEGEIISYWPDLPTRFR